jgi:type I restriction enzyme S subunit
MYSPAFSEQLEKTTVGAAIKNVASVKVLKEIALNLPPLQEQKQIVAVLDAAFEGLTRARTHIETNLQNARELFDGGLLSVFGSLTDPAYMQLLKDVSDTFGRGKSKHRPRNDKSLYGGNVPFIQTGDVRNSGQSIETYSQTYSEKGLAQSKLWPAGTVCITIAANIAETGVLSFDACFPDSIIGMIPDETKTTSKYVEYLLQFFQKRLKALGEGAAQDNINLKTFETEYFPFPDLEQQSRAISILDELAEQRSLLENHYRQKLQDLADLRQSLLQKAFAGGLT